MADKPPKTINAEIREILRQISPETPKRLSPSGAYLYRPGLCHINVRDHVALHGGEPCFGWIVRDAGAEFHFEFHCVWRDPAGSLIDVTPPPKSMRSMLFLPDPNRRFDFAARVTWANRVWNRNAKSWMWVWRNRRISTQTVIVPRDIEG